jgi:hypothetical protein
VNFLLLFKRSPSRFLASCGISKLWKGMGFLVPHRNPIWITTCFWIAVATYSRYFHLHSTSGGHLLYSQPEDVLCRGDEGLTTVQTLFFYQPTYLPTYLPTCNKNYAVVCILI